MSAGRPRTIADVLDAVAGHTAVGFHFADETTGEEQYVPYADVHDRALRFGGALTALGLRRGDRVALILPDNERFVLAFLGAIMAGLVPVPIYPPAGLRRLRGYLEGTLHIVQRSGARALVTDASIKAILGTVKAGSPALEHVVDAAALDLAGATPMRADVRPDDLCFLQFTSGSTSAPKGVAVTHANLVANVGAIAHIGLRAVPGVDSGASWLPLYHDMGLIGFVLVPLISQCSAALMPPLLFLKRPATWLQTISRHRASVSFGPTFAYALATKRIRDDDVEGLDLSCWRVAGCGAEPIRADVLEAFADRFAHLGFDRGALRPCYGLAEATLAVSFAPFGSGVRADRVDPVALEAEGEARTVPADVERAVEVVDCGPAFEGHAVAVFDPDDRESATPLPDRQVGELRVRGPSVTPGYFDDPERSAAAFAGEWLRTGDLGYLVDGHVFVCGRLKELIIANGRNLHPQDLEWEASQVPGVRKGNVVAFGTCDPGGTDERIVVAFETTERDPAGREALAREVARAVRRATGLPLADVVALPKGAVPKTSSGKLRRGEVRRLYEAGELASASPGRQREGRWGVARELARSQLAYARARIRDRRRS